MAFETLNPAARDSRQARVGAVRPGSLVAAKLADLDERLSELRAFRRSLVRSLRECDATLAGQRDGDCPVVELGAPGQRPPQRGALKREHVG